MDKRIIENGIKDIILKYISVITQYYNVEAIILFGSFAKGTNTEDSDIDIAVILKDSNLDVIDEELNLMRLRRKIDTRIEPHIIRIEDYKNVVTPFVKEVIETGIKVA